MGLLSCSTPTPTAPNDGECSTCDVALVDLVPADGATDVDLSPTIAIDVGPGNYVSAELHGPDGEALPGLPMGPESITFEPFDRLAPGTTYTLQLKLGCGTENVVPCVEEATTFTTALPNRWYASPDIPVTLWGTGGTAIGSRPDDGVYVDQFGDEVRLFQFYGQTVQLVLTAAWCGPCLAISEELAAAAPALAAQGVQVVEILVQGSDGGPATADEAELWATTTGAQHPVLVGNATWATWLAASNNQLPVLPILDDAFTLVFENNVPFSVETAASYAP
jgi:hypothetical protein